MYYGFSELSIQSTDKKGEKYDSAFRTRFKGNGSHPAKIGRPKKWKANESTQGAFKGIREIVKPGQCSIFIQISNLMIIMNLLGYKHLNNIAKTFGWKHFGALLMDLFLLQ